MAGRKREITEFGIIGKVSIYHALAKLNSSFESILDTFEIFQQAGIIKPKYKRLFRGFTLELQAEINADILNLLHDAELADWAKYGKARQSWERYLAGSRRK